MKVPRVSVFRPFPLEVGQKIRIEKSPLGGDWEVVWIDDRKVRLRCPVSGRELERDRFCYFVQEEENAPWPSGE